MLRVQMVQVALELSDAIGKQLGIISGLERILELPDLVAVCCR